VRGNCYTSSLAGNVSKVIWDELTGRVGAVRNGLSMLVCKRSAACG
jgi:hypothetical protein